MTSKKCWALRIFFDEKFFRNAILFVTVCISYDLMNVFGELLKYNSSVQQALIPYFFYL